MGGGGLINHLRGPLTRLGLGAYETVVDDPAAAAS